VKTPIDLRASQQDALESFQSTLPWALDAFQVEAIRKLRDHDGVLVSAPTSAGKTVIADYCAHEALAAGVRVIYTTPLKALSNQKYHDYQRRYGEAWVGLVTGEHTINDEAAIVVMTTEILRNVIYEDPQRLRAVRYVILDEVHYIDDFPRGAVWEEIIIQAPAHIKFVGLSATISNVQEVADWMSEHRGRVATVSVSERPVELKLWLAMDNQLYPLFDEKGGIVRATWARAQQDVVAEHLLARLRNAPQNDLLEVIEALRGADMLPAIYFIFSRRGCREALARCAYHNIDLTTAAEKTEIDRRVGERLGAVGDADEASLYFGLMNGDMLRRGVAVHHAGVLPYLKELVEELFQTGLLKVVFATETLSLGIHMPARAVVVSTFTKFDGQNFQTLTSGELTQLMGRAGRRGIDRIGHGIVLKDAEVDIGTIYEAAMGEDMTVESKFAPTYNMALNLLRRYSMEEVDRLMDGSFGQFQKRIALNRMDQRLANLRQRLSDLQAKQFRHPREHCTERTIASFLHAEEEANALRARLRRARRAHWRGGRGRGGRDTKDVSLGRSRAELKELQQRRDASLCLRCPFLAEHRTHHGQIRVVQAELRGAEAAGEKSMHEYRNRMRAQISVLNELGFLEGHTPTAKGQVASRIYGENTLILAEAIAEGWLEELTPAALNATMVMLTAEDRGRERGRPEPRRFPDSMLQLSYRRLRVIYFRCAGRERDHGEENLRPLSTDYVGFIYDWSAGKPLTEIQPPAGVEFGDAIKALKGLYSTLRQAESAVAEQPRLQSLMRRGKQLLERDLITRI
jgi:ATP-dependent RNA helicase HelY